MKINKGRNQDGKQKHNYYSGNNQYNMNYSNNYKNNMNMQNEYNKMIPTYMNDNNYRVYQSYNNNGWNMNNETMQMWDGIPGVMMNTATNRPMMNQMMNQQNMGIGMRNKMYNQMNQEYPMTRGQKVYQTYERRIQYRQQKKRAREMDVIDITDKKAKH
jgi:hypothetical protein